MSARTTLVVADDHPVVLKGLVGLLEEEDELDVLAACGDGRTALAAIREKVPHVAVLDISMPFMTGLQVLSEIRRGDLKTKVVFLTASATNADILAAVAGGTAGLILKDMAADELIICIRAVAAGGRWLPRGILDRAFGAELSAAVSGREACEAMTTREREIALLVASGLSNKEIARNLNLTEGTVKVHLNRIYQKASVNNRTALAALALAYREMLIAS